jgi:hypothetical protein
MGKRKYKPTEIEMADKATRWANGIGNLRGADIQWLSGSRMYRAVYHGYTDYFDSLDDCIVHLLQVQRVWRKPTYKD